MARSRKKDLQDESIDMFYYFKNHLAKTGRYEFYGSNIREQQRIANEGRGSLLELKMKNKYEQDQMGKDIYISLLLFPRLHKNSVDIARKKMSEYYAKDVYTIIILNENDPQSLHRVGAQAYNLREKGFIGEGYSYEQFYNIIKVNDIEKYLATPYFVKDVQGNTLEYNLVQYYQPAKAILKEGMRTFNLKPVYGKNRNPNNYYRYASEIDMSQHPPTIINAREKRNQHTLTGSPLHIKEMNIPPAKKSGRILPVEN